jgi:hypothetical protein
VRHGGGAFLPFGEGFCHFPDLRALQVADLRREFLDGRPKQGQRQHDLRVAVALQDLRGNGRACQAQTLAHMLLDLWFEVGVGSHRPGDFTHIDVQARARQARALPTQLLNP